MYRKQLAYKHGLLPMDIISVAEMSLLTDHFSAARKCTTDNFEKEMGKQFDAQSRALCAELYTELRDKGFMPDSIGTNGKILWNVQQLDDVQAEAERYMPNLPDLSETGPYNERERKQMILDCQRKCRTGFNGLFAGHGQ